MTLSRLLTITILLPLSLLITSTCLAVPSPSVTLTAEEQQWLSEHPVIKLAPDPDFKPIEYFDKNGAYQGAAADIIRILEKKLGITITVVQLKNWDEAMEKFRNHEVDLLGAMVRTPNREKFALFTDTLVSVPGGIFSRDKSLKNLTLKQLKGLKVAVVSNYAAHDIIRNQYPEVDLQVVPDVSTGLAKASLGMVDVYVENMANATFYAQEAGITNLRLAGKTEFDYQWGIGVRKDWPVLRTILNKGLAAVGEEERDRALKRWIHVEGRQWRPSKTFIVGTAALFLALMLLVVGCWSYSLKKEVRSRTKLLQKELEERQKAENDLKALAGELEARVHERTGDLARQHEELLKSEELFRTLVDNIPLGITLIDQSYRVVMVNKTQAAMFNHPKEWFTGEYCYEKFEKREATCPHCPGRISMETGTVAVVETEGIRDDGSRFSVRIHSVPLSGAAGVSSGFIEVVEDITEAKNAESERSKLEQQMLHAQKLESLGVLAGGIAHDFNNILTAIVGNAELALMRLSPESPVLDNLKRIEHAAARASDLAKQMLAYSGKGSFLIESIDLNRLVEEMGHMLEVSISKKAVLRYNLTKPLPAVEADATQIRQIIMNLVINASEAIGDKSGVIAITTGCFECNEAYLKEAWLTDPISEGLYVFLEISDTGCGMSKETRAKLFDPFFTTKFTGRGLGMAAVLGIIRGHKGAIKVYSEVDKGSSFKILLPAGERPAEFRNSDAGDEIWKGGGVVLLVDDEETVLTIGAEMLRELGFEVITAGDGRKAIEVYKSRGDISLVMLDLTMPHMDGEQCFRELRRIDANVKVVMSSGFSEHEVAQKFTGKAPTGFIQKPYNLTTLRQIISGMETSGR